MSAEDVVESTAIEVEHIEHEPRSLAVVPVTPTLAVTPTVEAKELVARLDVIKEAMQTAMVRDVDYGIIPGTDKPALYKPGSEKLAVLFQLDVQLDNQKRWGPGDHLTVISHATVFHAPSGARLGFGEGICSTKEKKYGKRQAKRVCPTCGAAAIFKSKKDPGWYCWGKMGGCGAKFANDKEPSIVNQEVGEVENPDLGDTWNTVDKMASKRARVDAILSVTGASALFTQDVEDNVPASEPAAPPPALVLASDDDIGELRASAKGLDLRTVRLVMSSGGLAAPAPEGTTKEAKARSVFREVPLDRVGPLIDALSAVARPIVSE